ncbi:MAG: sulfurtransferase TusA family protein [Bacillota bacterium]
MKPEKVYQTLDARGLLCPMPIVRSTKAMAEVPEGEVLEILATDKGACVDVPAWCNARKYTLLHQDQQENVYRFYVKKGR